jgi:hypothetical protein
MRNRKFAPVHPAEILLHDFMDPLGLSQYALAKAIGVTPIRIRQIVLEPRRGSIILKSSTGKNSHRLAPARAWATTKSTNSCE